MTLKCEITLSASFVHKQSGQILNIDKVIIQEYDEYSEEYKQLCKEFELESGVKRDTNKDKFDRMLLERLVELSKESCKETINNLSTIFKQHCKANADGYVEFGGWILKLQDYSAVLFRDLKVNISKR